MGVRHIENWRFIFMVTMNIEKGTLVRISKDCNYSLVPQYDNFNGKHLFSFDLHKKKSAMLYLGKCKYYDLDMLLWLIGNRNYMSTIHLLDYVEIINL